MCSHLRMDEEEQKMYQKRAQQGHGRVESQPKYTSLISDSGLKGAIRSLLEVVRVQCPLVLSTLQASVQSGISSW